MARQAQRNDAKSRNTTVSAACCPHMNDVIGPEVPVNDPRFLGGELALDGCPLLGRWRPVRAARRACPARSADDQPIQVSANMLHCFWRLRIRWEIRDDIHEALLSLAYAIIFWRRLRNLFC
jgi:hypothetical protein